MRLLAGLVVVLLGLIGTIFKDDLCLPLSGQLFQVHGHIVHACRSKESFSTTMVMTNQSFICHLPFILALLRFHLIASMVLFRLLHLLNPMVLVMLLRLLEDLVVDGLCMVYVKGITGTIHKVHLLAGLGGG